MLSGCGFWGDFWNVVDSDLFRNKRNNDLCGRSRRKTFKGRIDAKMKSFMNEWIIFIPQILTLNCIKHSQSRNLTVLLNFKK